MNLNIFKKRKNNNTLIEENNMSEREILISKIGEKELESLCLYNSFDKENLSIHLLTLLSNNSGLLEKLKYIFDNNILKKINENTLTLEDIPTYKLELLNLPIFNEKEKRRINLLNKNINFTNNNYSFVNSDIFIDEIKTDKLDCKIESCISGINLNKIKYILPVEENINFTTYNSKFTYVFPLDKKEYDIDTTYKFNKDTIIITDYNTFLELTKENLDLLEKYTFVLEDNRKNIEEIENKIIFKKYDTEYFKPSVDNIIKINHLLYLIDNSDMNDDRKKYYLYNLKNEYLNSCQWYSYNNNFLKVVNKLTNELTKEDINKLTDNFNKLDIENKTKEVIQDEFTPSMFISNFDNIDNVNCLDLLRKISYLSEDKKQLVLSDERIINKLKVGLQEESYDQLYGYFREVFKIISPNEFLNIYKDEGIKKYFKGHFKSEGYIIFACLCEKNINETVKYILTDEKLFNEFFMVSNNFYSMFYDLSYELFKEIIFRFEKHNYKYNLEFLSSISYENQINIFNEEIKDSTILNIIPYFKVESVSCFFENNIRARHLYKDFNIARLVNSGIRFNSDILKNKDFFNGLKDESFVEFRNNINNVEKYNDPTFIEERLKEYYEELISCYNPETKMFYDYEKELLGRKWNIRNNDYILSPDVTLKFGNLERNSSDEQELIEYLKRQTSKKISEIVIDCLFQDNIYNVWLNIKEMLRFNEKLANENKVLDKEKEYFYKLILNFDNVDSDKKIELYHKLKDKNYNLFFYEDVRKLKDLSYNLIQESLLNPKSHPEFLDKENTSKYGVAIYDLRDKEYTILVRRENRHRDKTTMIRGCYSLISNENSSVYGGTEGYLYGYNTIEKDRVLHILETDSYSSSLKDESSKFVNRIMTPKEIVNNNSWYSEVQIINKKDNSDNDQYNAKKPDFIVVFDNITGIAVEESKRLNIPIVRITSNILKDENKTNITFDTKYDIYVKNSIDEINQKKSR